MAKTKSPIAPESVQQFRATNGDLFATSAEATRRNAELLIGGRAREVLTHLGITEVGLTNEQLAELASNPDAERYIAALANELKLCREALASKANGGSTKPAPAPAVKTAVAGPSPGAAPKAASAPVATEKKKPGPQKGWKAAAKAAPAPKTAPVAEKKKPGPPKGFKAGVKKAAAPAAKPAAVKASAPVATEKKKPGPQKGWKAAAKAAPAAKPAAAPVASVSTPPPAAPPIAPSVTKPTMGLPPPAPQLTTPPPPPPPVA